MIRNPEVIRKLIAMVEKTFAGMEDDENMYASMRHSIAAAKKGDMLQVNYERFAEKGVTVAVVMQSTPESIRAALKDEPLSFPVICDPEYKLYNDLEIKPAGSREEMLGSEETLQKFRKKREAIRELGYTHGEYEGIEEQLPAFFYMNEKLKVITAHYAEGIGDMPTAEEMLAM